MDSRATPLDMDFAFSIASTEIFEVCVFVAFFAQKDRIAVSGNEIGRFCSEYH